MRAEMYPCRLCWMPLGKGKCSYLSVFSLWTIQRSHICVDGNNRCPHIPPADSPKSLLNHRVSGGLKASATDHISEEPHMHLKTRPCGHMVPSRKASPAHLKWTRPLTLWCILKELIYIWTIASCRISVIHRYPLGDMMWVRIST